MGFWGIVASTTIGILSIVFMIYFYTHPKKARGRLVCRLTSTTDIGEIIRSLKSELEIEDGFKLKIDDSIREGDYKKRIIYEYIISNESRVVIPPNDESFSLNLKIPDNAKLIKILPVNQHPSGLLADWSVSGDEAKLHFEQFDQGDEVHIKAIVGSIYPLNEDELQPNWDGRILGVDIEERKEIPGTYREMLNRFIT